MQQAVYNPPQQDVYNSNGPVFEQAGPPFQSWAPDTNAAQLHSRDNESATRSQQSEKTKRSIRPRPRASEPPIAATTRAAAQGDGLSKLAQRREMLEGKMGSDHREKAPVRRVNGILHGLVKGKWEKAGYHCDFRGKLIDLDAQQPGAPVFHDGMSENYTSYSPVTRDWTADPGSVRDSKGRQVHFLPTRPADLPDNPDHGYLMCEGLFMLDQNDRVIKTHPGAPRTLSTDLPGWMIESLRRVFGMTYPDLLARMPAFYRTKGGILRRLFEATTLSNRVLAFREEHKDRGIVPWHDREKDKATKDGVANDHI